MKSNLKEIGEEKSFPSDSELSQYIEDEFKIKATADARKE